MKKILLILMIALWLPMTAAADDNEAKPAIRFDSPTDHDFGTIRANEGSVSAEYTFTNTGTAPLVIINVTNGGCGCTTPDYPKAPIAPGESDKITIHFNPTGRRGEFNREVRVKTNATKKRLKLEFSGVIVP